MEDLVSSIAWIRVLIITLIYILGLVIYRVNYHSLARFPGPKLAAVTRLYEAYFDVVQGGRYTFKIAELHKKYGPIVRISPHELHVSDSAFYEKLFRQDGSWNKYSWSYDAFSAKYSSICSIDHETHKRRRAPLNAFFSKVAVWSQQSMIQSHLSKLCARIDEYVSTDRTLNLSHAMSAFTGDVATEYIIGKSYNNLDRQDFNTHMTNVLQSSGVIWRVTKHVRWLGPTLKSLPMSVVEKIGDDGARAFLAFLKVVMQLTRDIMASHKSQTQEKGDSSTLVHNILQSSLPDSEKTFERINDEVSTVLGAALETTAQTLRVILYHIYTNPLVLHRLQTELSSAIDVDERSQDLLLRSLEQLPYLTAVLKEGLRLSPGLATRTARLTNKPLTYGKWTIPPGTPVGMTTLLMHTDGDLYPNPQQFNPERWMDTDKLKSSDKPFAPFSRGTRICLGMHLAWAELYLTVATLVQQFEFRFDNAGPKDVVGISDQFIIGTKDQSGLRVYVSRR